MRKVIFDISDKMGRVSIRERIGKENRGLKELQVLKIQHVNISTYRVMCRVYIDGSLFRKVTSASHIPVARDKTNTADICPLSSIMPVLLLLFLCDLTMNAETFY